MITKVISQDVLKCDNCLHLALVRYSILRKAGYNPTLKIGVLRNSRDFLAHAWVELDDDSLDIREKSMPFTILSHFKEGVDFDGNIS